MWRLRQRILTTRLNSRLLGRPDRRPFCSESSRSSGSSGAFAARVDGDSVIDKGAEGVGPKTTSAARYAKNIRNGSNADIQNMAGAEAGVTQRQDTYNGALRAA